jgi:septal ring factor EnvC (AmiA/AmiB activator)
VIKELVTITPEQWTDLCGMLDMPPQVSVADLEGAVHRLAKSCELQYQHVNKLEAENKRLREALGRAKERINEYADRTVYSQDDVDELRADLAQIDAMAGFLDAPRA